MKCSDECVNAIKEFEGLRLDAYVCPGGLWTIGYGHTGNDVVPGMHITEERAEELLRVDLRFTELWVQNFYPAMRQNQYDALVSLIYNIGINAYRTSTLRKKIDLNAPLADVEKQWLRWKHAKGKVLPGLERRRKWEIEQFKKNAPIVH